MFTPDAKFPLDGKPPRRGRIDTSGAPRFTFSLGTLFLVITLIAAALGMLVSVPLFGLLLLLLTPMAWLRTSAALAERRAWQEPTDAWDLAMLFLGSLLVVVAISAAVLAAFLLGACAALLFGVALMPAVGNELGLLICLGAVSLGVGLAIYVGGNTARAIWPVGGVHGVERRNRNEIDHFFVRYRFPRSRPDRQLQHCPGCGGIMRSGQSCCLECGHAFVA